MFAGIAKVDITPEYAVTMEGMIREHKSEGVHDRLYARALALANSTDPESKFVIVSVDVCVLVDTQLLRARQAASRRTGIPVEQIIIAATHTHSGPATVGIFDDAEEGYTEKLLEQLTEVIAQATGNLRPALLGCAAGQEDTVSQYRRLLADDGHVVMNWEPFPPERIMGPLGVIDPELGVLKVSPTEAPDEVLSLLFNHAGHPNVMSGENYLLSADYPGKATALLDAELGGMSMFVNGAQGTMDIDGLRDRDWEGVDRIGNALATAAAKTARAITPADAIIRGGHIRYTLPARQISDKEYAWAQVILAVTGGKVQALADGVGDDYLALLYTELRGIQDKPAPIEQSCFAIGDTALLSMPFELYTEVGMVIKQQSPFTHTWILGLANGEFGYVPTRKAIAEGGYAEVTRRLDDSAAEIITAKSLELLGKVFAEK